MFATRRRAGGLGEAATDRVSIGERDDSVEIIADRMRRGSELNIEQWSQADIKHDVEEVRVEVEGCVGSGGIGSWQ